jgi:class 3 adenylate cyclase
LRSLQLKFSALVVALLVVACVVLAAMATRHERRSVEAEIERASVALAINLAQDAKVPLIEDDTLALGALVRNTGQERGVVAVQLVKRDGRVAAALEPMFVGIPSELAPSYENGVRLERRGDQLEIAAEVTWSGDRIGEARIHIDLARLIEPILRETRQQLAWVALGVTALGVFAGVGFVALLVGPLRRLRAGVERLAKGDLAVRVPPTSRDEVGELTAAFNEMGESLQQKERIQRAFGRYASDYVLQTLLENPEGSELEGAERDVTLLFADIRGFTRLSENLEPTDVVALLNEVFQLISDCILSRGGTIDKFIGDSVMAYFGAPIPSGDHPIAAVTAAVAIERALAERNAKLEHDGLAVGVGIGIHTGAVVVGNIGSDRRTDFTAIGDSVNVAARLEKLARPGEILVSEAVQRRVRGSHRLRFEGERQLSGRQEPVHVYSVELPGSADEAA